MKTVASRFYALLLATAFVAEADAHAFLDHTTPAVGSTIHESPTRVQLHFTQELEGAFSTVRVLDRAGTQVDKRDQQVDAGNRTLLQVSLPPLAAGRYRVVWRALSVDTHVTQGDFTFDLVP